MSQAAWLARISRARWSAILSAAAAFGYLGVSDVIGWPLLVFAGAGMVAAQLYWRRSLSSEPLSGDLSGAEKAFQTVVALAGLALVGGGYFTGASMMATLAVAVSMVANAGACRRRDIGFGAVSAMGTCLLVLGSVPTLAGVPLLLVAWALSLMTVTQVLGLRPLEKSGFLTQASQPSMSPAGSAGASDSQLAAVWQGAGQGRPRWVGRAVVAPFLISVLAGLLMILIDPVGDAGGPSGAAGDLMGQRGPQRGDVYTGPMDLNARGPLGNRPVASVEASSPSHWRGSILADYDGRVFSPRRAATTAQVGQRDNGLQVTGLMSNAAPPTDRTNRFTVRPQAEGVPVIAPGHLQAVGIPLSAARLLPGSTLTTAGRPDSYDVTVSLPAPANATPTNAAPANGATSPDPAAERSAYDVMWLQLPQSVTPRTRALAQQLTAGATTTQQKVRAIEVYLLGNHRYNLEAERAPRGRDAVDHFLFDSREGFCEHFAAAEVVLLRAAGVPARVATGFNGGEPDPADPARRMIMQYNSHAWTEVYVAGQGWLTSDSTPAGRLDVKPDFSTIVQREFRKIMADPAKRAVVAGVLLGFAGLVWLGLLLSWAWQSRRRTRKSPPRTALESAVDRFLEALASTGSPSRHDETLRELAARAPAASPGLRVVERSLYSPCEVPPDETSSAVALLDRETRRLRKNSGKG